MNNRPNEQLLDDVAAEEENRVAIPLPAVNRYPRLAQGASIALGVVGAGAGVFYWVPSKKCVESDTCGESLVNALSSMGLSDATASQVATWSLFLSGAIGYSGSNMYYSSQFYDNFARYLGEQKSMRSKLAKGGFVVVYGVGQTAQIFLSALGIGDTPLSLTTIVTVGGALPGNLFGAVGIARNTIPQTYAALSQFAAIHCYYPLRPPVTEAERVNRLRATHYLQEQATFVKRAQANLSQLISKARAMQLEDEPLHALDFLFQQQAVLLNPSIAMQLESGIVKLAGAGLTLNFAYAFTKNTFDVMAKYVPQPAWQYAITALLSASSIYSNLKVTVAGVEASYKNFKNVLGGRPIDSLSYQLRPKTMALATTLCSAISVLSYAAANVTWDSGYQWSGKDVLRHGARAGIDIYHTYALILLSIEVLSKLTKDPKAKALFKIEREVNNLKTQSLPDFIKFAEELDAPHKTLYGIKTSNDDEMATPLTEMQPEHSGALVVASRSAERPQRRESWCSWFSASRKNREPLQRDEPGNNYIPLQRV